MSLFSRECQSLFLASFPSNFIISSYDHANYLHILRIDRVTFSGPKLRWQPLSQLQSTCDAILFNNKFLEQNMWVHVLLRLGQCEFHHDESRDFVTASVLFSERLRSRYFTSLKVCLLFWLSFRLIVSKSISHYLSWRYVSQVSLPDGTFVGDRLYDRLVLLCNRSKYHDAPHQEVLGQVIS